MSQSPLPVIKLFGIPLYTGTMDEVVELVIQRLTQKQTAKDPFIIFTPNAEQTVMAQQRRDLAKAFTLSSLNLPDSIGMVWSHRLIALSHGLPAKIHQRIAGIDAMQILALSALKRGKKVFLLGSRGMIAQRAARALIQELVQADASSKVSDIRQLITSSSGTANISRETPEAFTATLKEIKDHQTDILFIAYGAPHQELWSIKHSAELKRAGVKVVMVTGGSFDMLAGQISRAPVAFQNKGLEWLWRLFQEPSRWRRQLQLIKFIQLTLREAIFK